MVNRGIFGGGVFSVVRGRQVRLIGGPQRTVSEIGIKPLRGAYRKKDGTMDYAVQEPFIPKTLREDMHHGGNSACFAIQLAHLMGARQIFLVGFTLQTGSNYFFGRTNPVTRRSTIYQHERAIAWLRFYEKIHPGRVQLDPSFSGPIYDVFRKANFDARQEPARYKPADDGGLQPDAPREHPAGVERARPASPPNPIRHNVKPPGRQQPKGRVVRGR